MMPGTCGTSFGCERNMLQDEYESGLKSVAIAAEIQVKLTKALTHQLAIFITVQIVDTDSNRVTRFGNLVQSIHLRPEILIGAARTKSRHRLMVSQFVGECQHLIDKRTQLREENLHVALQVTTDHTGYYTRAVLFRH